MTPVPRACRPRRINEGVMDELLNIIDDLVGGIADFELVD
jgi:hypothetical protein